MSVLLIVVYFDQFILLFVSFPFLYHNLHNVKVNFI